MGQLTYGSFGQKNAEFTCIGDTINTVSRIEASTRVLGCNFLCSDSIHWKYSRLAGEVVLKGKGAMKLYEICD